MTSRADISVLPDYVLSEAEDRTRRRYVTPSNISPWADCISMQEGVTVAQAAELHRQGRDPASVDWMWVTVPVTDPFEFDRRSYRRAVQKLWCVILGARGDRITVLSPKGRVRSVYAGGQISRPAKRRARGGFLGR